MQFKAVLVIALLVLVGFFLAFTPFLAPLAAMLVPLGIAASAATFVLALLLAVVGLIIGLVINRLFFQESKSPNPVAQRQVAPKEKQRHQDRPQERRSQVTSSPGPRESRKLQLPKRLMPLPDFKAAFLVEKEKMKGLYPLGVTNPSEIEGPWMVMTTGAERSALYSSIRTGDVAAVQAQLLARPNLAYQSLFRGQHDANLALAAAACGQPAILQLLTAINPEGFRQEKVYGSTPLVQAVAALVKAQNTGHRARFVGCVQYLAQQYPLMLGKIEGCRMIPLELWRESCQQVDKEIERLLTPKATLLKRSEREKDWNMFKVSFDAAMAKVSQHTDSTTGVTKEERRAFRRAIVQTGDGWVIKVKAMLLDKPMLALASHREKSPAHGALEVVAYEGAMLLATLAPTLCRSKSGGSPWNETLLHTALANWDEWDNACTDCIVWLVENCPESLDDVDAEGRTPLALWHVLQKEREGDQYNGFFQDLLTPRPAKAEPKVGP